MELIALYKRVIGLDVHQAQIIMQCRLRMYTGLRFIPTGVGNTFSPLTCLISSDHGRLKGTDARFVFGGGL